MNKEFVKRKEGNNMKSFITGSQRYGTPTDKSDIDLVVYVDQGTELLLRDHNENENENEIKYNFGSRYAPVRFGKLNLILITDKTEFKIWKRCSKDLENKKPVLREEAVRFIQMHLQAHRSPKESILDLDNLIL